MKTNYSHFVWLIVINLCRFILAGVFIFSGFVKAIDPLGSAYKLHDYFVSFGLASFIPDFAPLLLGVLLSAFEFILGVSLLFGTYKRTVSWLTFLMMLFMTPLTLYLAIMNPISDCGCFGDAWVLSNWHTFFKNVFLLTAAWLLFSRHRNVLNLISSKSAWMVFVYTTLFVFFLSSYCLRNLPIIDFMAYKTGTHLPDQMTVPKGAQPSVFETTYLMEKSGVQKTFLLEAYPDSTWTFVEAKTKEVKKGYTPPITDFAIKQVLDGEDITERVLADSSYTFLLVAYQIGEASDSNIDLINEIYDYSVENQYGFYCLTASSEEEIQNWKDKTGAEYQFCITDEIPLKSMVRSNPGLVLLRQGTVIRKWSHNQLPDEYVLTTSLDKIPLGQLDQVHTIDVVLKVLLWFFGPLILISILDKIVIVHTMRKRLSRKLLTPFIYKKMRKKIVAGNWKMNKNLQEGLALATELNEALAGSTPKCDVVIGTPYIHLAAAAQVVDGSKIGVSAQNCADKESGAYTGEISASMIASTGAKYVILGHSERRAYYGETNETLKEKVVLTLANGLTPIFCIGEVLAEREAGIQNEIVSGQLAGALYDLSAADFSKIVLAYEPVWAIGTGKTASPEQAQEIHAYIRSTIEAKYGKEVAQKTSILYGGSCNASNAKTLFANADVDGGLIGGASLKVADFKAIIDAF